MNRTCISILAVLLAFPACSRDSVETARTTTTTQVVETTTVVESPAETTTIIALDAPRSAPPEAATANGQAIYTEKCASCHGADGKKATGGVSLASDVTRQRTDAELLMIVREGNGTASAAAHRRAALTEAEVWAVTAYLRSLK